MATIPTYDDMLRTVGDGDPAEFVMSCIQSYKNSEEYKTAVLADEYDHQQNRTILEYTRTLYNMSGVETEDFTASNNRLCSNFFNRLNTQRCLYSLGKGVSFVDVGESGEDRTKEALGPHFDHDIKEAGYYALIHGRSHLFWDVDRMHVFKATEYVPLVDESTGEPRAGIRFWQLDSTKPMIAVLYEEDGFTKFGSTDEGLRETQPKRAYKTTYETIPYDGEVEVVEEENYTSLPIVTMYGSRLKQSTLVGMRSSIDAYDLVRSGFANDMTDCAEIYWIVNNAGGMDDHDLMQFRDRLKLQHIANVDGSDGAGATPYTQDIPYQARETFLAEIRNGIYEDFGALDVHTVAAGATNDHIDAAYQPMDENADDFESWVSEAIVKLLALIGIDDEPVFNRTRISNQLEQVQMVLSEAQYLDRETVLRKLPNITPEEVQAILERSDEEDMARFAAVQAIQEAEEQNQTEQGEEAQVEGE